MSSNLPHFIQEHLVFVSDVHLSRRQRSTIAILKNLQLYELQRKQILNSIDLQTSILNKAQNRMQSVSPVVDVTQVQENDVLGSSIRCSNSPVDEIVLGKYIYQNRNFKAVYIVLKFWNLLVILKKNSEGFTLEAEYEGVESFKIIKGRKFESKLAISFIDSSLNLVTNLQKKSPIQTDPKVLTNKKVEDVIRMKQSELLVHKTITKKNFSKLQNSSVFGSNFLRMPHFDEMRILQKCSDAWLKLSADDKIVIGVPLVNNSTSRLTTLKNLRGLLQCSGRDDLSYTFAMYEQNSSVSSMEDIKSVFENEIRQSDWSKCEAMSLRPETFYVLIFEMNIKELVERSTLELLLFVSFDVTLADKIFPQKSFLAQLSFRDIFDRDTHKINFHPHHMHRDLLCVMSTCHKLEISLNFTQGDTTFKEYLCNNMDFLAVSLPQGPSETMQVDECDEETEVKTQPEFFYNNNPNSLWHGTFIAITEACNKSSVAKIFTKTQNKSIVFLRFLETELRLKCGINDICKDFQTLRDKLIQFESLLRDECKLQLEMLSTNNSGSRDTIQNIQQEIYLMELKTDIWMEKLKS